MKRFLRTDPLNLRSGAYPYYLPVSCTPSLLPAFGGRVTTAPDLFRPKRRRLPGRDRGVSRRWERRHPPKEGRTRMGRRLVVPHMSRGPPPMERGPGGTGGRVPGGDRGGPRPHRHVPPLERRRYWKFVGSALPLLASLTPPTYDLPNPSHDPSPTLGPFSLSPTPSPPRTRTWEEDPIGNSYIEEPRLIKTVHRDISMGSNSL